MRKRYKLSDILRHVASDGNSTVSQKFAAKTMLNDISGYRDSFDTRAEIMGGHIAAAFGIPVPPQEMRVEVIGKKAIELAKHYQIEPVDAPP